MEKQFPQYDGFRSTVCVSANRADIIKGESIQVININSNHWICVYINDNKDTVDIYDSLYSNIKVKLVDDVLELIQSSEHRVTFRNMMMQSQDGYSDCGVFAIAVATSLCYKEDPTVVRWKVGLMRMHLLKCIEGGRMEPFPQARKDLRCQRKTRKIVTYDIHCVCRKRHNNRQIMKQCDSCQGWFHQKCLKIPKSSLSTSNTWKCPNC